MPLPARPAAAVHAVVATVRPAYGVNLLVAAALVGGCGFTTPAPGGDIDAVAVLEAVEEQRIGSVEDPELGFSRLTAVDVDADGRVYVGEAQDLQIRVYSPDGRLLHRIGRRGGGPGEFQGMPQFGVQGDTVWAYDGSAGRITLFDRAGRVLSTGPTHGEAIPLREGRGFVMPLRMRPDGLFVSELRRVAFSRDDPPSGLGPDDAIPVPRLLFNAAGQVVDTLGWDPSPPPRMVPPPGHSSSQFRSITVGSRPFGVPDPPTTLPIWVTLDDGRIAVEQDFAASPASGEFTVTRLDLDGDTVWHRVLRYTPVPFDAAGLDSLAARSARGAQVISGGRPPPAPEDQPVIARQIRAAMEFPPYRLPVQYTRLGRDGTLWLVRDGDEGAPVRWLALDRQGTLRGEVTLPDRARILWSSGDTVWASVPDEFDVPWLVRYALRTSH